MNKTVLIAGLWVAFLATVSSAQGDRGEVASKPAETMSMPHPRDAALMQQSDGGWSYRKFPEGSRLYVYEGDSPGHSNCNLGCASAWPPLLVTSDRSRVGAWTAIEREDGQRQWAYKGQPVYYRFHDLPASEDQLQSSGFRSLEP